MVNVISLDILCLFRLADYKKTWYFSQICPFYLTDFATLLVGLGNLDDFFGRFSRLFLDYIQV